MEKLQWCVLGGRSVGVTLRFLSGVEECRSDASLRSVDECAACMVSSCFIVETIVYTPTLLPSTLLKNYTPIKKRYPNVRDASFLFFLCRASTAFYSPPLRRGRGRVSPQKKYINIQKASIIRLFNIFCVKCAYTFKQKVVFLCNFRPKGKKAILQIKDNKKI